MPLLGMEPTGLIWTFGRHWKGEVKMANKTMILVKMLTEVYFDFTGIPWQWNQAGPAHPLHVRLNAKMKTIGKHEA